VHEVARRATLVDDLNEGLVVEELDDRTDGPGGTTPPDSRRSTTSRSSRLRFITLPLCAARWTHHVSGHESAARLLLR
jgi:hypothetical protein